MFNIKLEEKSYKMSFKALPIKIKIQQSKNRQGGWGSSGRVGTMCPLPRGQLGLRKKKWLLWCSYNPHKNNIANHLKNICKTLEKLATYDSLVLLQYLNVEPEKESIATFLKLQFKKKNCVKQNTCFKNPDKPTCIDLILINCPCIFQNTDAFETGLSDFHTLTFTVATFSKSKT